MRINTLDLLKIRDKLILELEPKSINDNMFVSRSCVQAVIKSFFEELTEQKE